MHKTADPICLVAAVFMVCLLAGCQRPAGNEIEYQGDIYKLTKNYSDFDEFKNDPDNIAPNEIARIERAVTNAPIPKKFSSREQLGHAMFALKFPGYGLTSGGERPAPDGTVLSLWKIEIPRAGKDRVIVFQGNGGAYTLIDDFVATAEQGILQVTEKEGQLVYSEFGGKQVLTRPLKK